MVSVGQLLARALVLHAAAWLCFTASYAAARLVPFCPNFKAESIIHGVEDMPINVTAAWLAAGDETHGRLYSANCEQCTKLGCDYRTFQEWDGAIDPGMAHSVVAKFSVQYGKLWLAEGFTTCGGILSEGAGLDTYWEEQRQTHVLTQPVSIVNCMLKFLMFQGLPNRNIVTGGTQFQITAAIHACMHAYMHACVHACIHTYYMHTGRAESRIPAITISIEPTCRDIPPTCKNGGTG